MNVSPLLSRPTKLLKSGLFTDICIRVDCTSFSCHKIVLACASEFFEKLFQKDGLQTGEVTLEGTTPKIFKIFLDFIYTPGNCQFSKLESEVLMSLLKCANMWLAMEVENICHKILYQKCEDMQPDELIKLYAVSYQINNRPLMKRSIKFLQNEWPNEMDCQSTVGMGIDCFKEYFQTTIEIYHPLRRFAMVENWIKGNAFDSESASKSEQITNIVKSIDFEQMSLDEFYNGPGKSNVLSDSDKFEIMYKMAHQLRNNQWSFVLYEEKRNTISMFDCLPFKLLDD
ncbi:BTB/POZ and MATH domain-containing protein 6 [Drosophila elegans]|uniref:BTB/POZ and MATH domain-containing protein 6 n=1 Tax=Drosophila elegans TaxID=30023 RepID=UPI0007E70C17|nr:BTB/POZ and MATH domain-containing protein 6 [Drosophila elegans]